MKFVTALLLALSLCSPAEAGLVETMKRYQGLHESTHNKTLRKMLKINPRTTPWCGYMLAYAVRKNGRKPPLAFASARAWAGFGTKVGVRNARRGDVIVIRTSPSRLHAGAFTKHTKGKMCLIGGNTSNRVKESCYPTRNVYAVRR